MDNCTVPPSGWRCTRAAGHDGPCAAIPSYMSPNATLWREIDALGGSGDDGHSQALDKVLAILERRGFTEHSDPFTTPTPDRFGEGYRAGVEASGEWQDIASAPKDRTEFLSYGGTQGRAGSVYPTKWLSPGPYSTENGKNTPGERRFQYPEGFYWAGYDGFVGPVDPTHWRPLPAAPSISALHPATGDEA